ncbi:hypothetical protein TrVE_jg6857 [Triparma verrucosa]|uniref:Ceramidase n=1 Tax=Triparma verrucosa TaxID=1606542 RepID=A0A9W7BKN2_9STRA|nr:hypothetical protein TrVE_jg6857 [Triparma verrucosa]
MSSGDDPQPTPTLLRRALSAFTHSFSFHIPWEGPPKTKRKVFAAIICIAAVFNAVVIFLVWLADSEDWLTAQDLEGWGGAIRQTPTAVGCEYAANPATRYLAQPITSLSNFGFTFTAVVILQFALLDLRHNGLKNLICNSDFEKLRESQLIGAHPLLSINLAGCCVVMCYTSFCWHASLTHKGGTMDMGSIYVICIYIIGLASVRLISYLHLRNSKVLTVAIHTVSFGALYAGYRVYEHNRLIGYENWEDMTIFLILGVVVGVPFPFFIGIARMLKNTIGGCILGKEWLKRIEKKEKEREVRRRRSWGLAILALISILAGKLFREYDQTWMCSDWFGPHHWFQGHALWHVFCAFAVLFVYLFFRSEVFNIYGYLNESREEEFNWAERGRNSGRSSSSGGEVMELTMVERRASREGIGEVL